MNKLLVLGFLWLAFFCSAIMNSSRRFEVRDVPESLVLKAKAEMIDILNESGGNKVQIQSVFHCLILHDATSVNITIYIVKPGGPVPSLFCLPCFCELCLEQEWLVTKINYGTFLKCVKEFEIEK